MSEVIIKHGRTVQREAIDRGDILLHSPEDWRRRLSTLAGREVPRILLFFGLLYPVLLAIMYLPFQLLSGEPPAGSDLQLFILVPAGITALLLVATLAFFRVGISRYPAPGVYENGVQVPFAIFIPWDEFGSLRHVRLGIKREPFIAIHLRYGRERTRWLWREYRHGHYAVSTEFLGEDGIQAIEERTELEVTG